jgi:hypothetical protein
LIAGQWYAEVTYSDASYIGQITQVPEPSSTMLSLAGLGVIFSCLYRRVVLPNILTGCKLFHSHLQSRIQLKSKNKTASFQSV